MEGRTLPSVTVTAIAGTPQSAVVNTAFAMPFQALVEDSGIPVGAGVSVTFDAPTELRGPTGTFPPAFPNGVTQVTVQTDASGIATAPLFTAFLHTGEYSVTASVSGGTSSAAFDLTNLPGPPASLTILTSTSQAATTGTTYATPFQLTVKDAFQNPVGPGVNLTFTAPASGASGTFPGGATSGTVATDANSEATAPPFTANGAVGGFEVTASVVGVSTPALFNLLNVSPVAVIDGPSAFPNVQVSITPTGVMGSLFYQGPIGGASSDYQDLLAPSTLTGLISFTFNGHTMGTSPTPNLFSVTLPSTGPLLPGPVRFHAAPGSVSALVLNASASAGVVTQPGQVRANGQAVLYSNMGTLTLLNATGVNAAVLPNTTDRANAFLIGPPDHRGRPTALQGNERFVQALYLDVLGRAGTLAEVQGWAAQVNAPGGSQVAVVAGIEASVEACERRIQTWYQTYLGRQAQGGEEVGWVNQLQAGRTEEEVLSGILGSAEFFARTQTLISSGTPAQRYVQALYQVLLGRSASSIELAGWDAGVTVLGLQGVALGFLHSQEFRTDQFEGYYNALLHRPGDSSGRDGWVDSSWDMLTTRIGFEGSPEFYSMG